HLDRAGADLFVERATQPRPLKQRRPGRPPDRLLDRAERPIRQPPDGLSGFRALDWNAWCQSVPIDGEEPAVWQRQRLPWAEDRQITDAPEQTVAVSTIQRVGAVLDQRESSVLTQPAQLMNRPRESEVVN